MIQFNVSQRNLLPVGYQLGAWHFTPGQFVDIQSRTKGKGTQSAVQRWNFGGQPASHGVSLAHRSLGSIGQHTNPGKVFKGKKMNGKFGAAKVTHVNYQVYKIDVDRCLVYVKGMVPGPRGVICKVFDTIWKKEENESLINYPTFIPDANKRYASIVEMLPPKDDPREVWIHDNALPKQVLEDTGE